MKAVILLNLLCFIYNYVGASHFRGGWITWEVIAETATTVTMEFTAHWSWNRGSYFCDQTTINSRNLIGPATGIICTIGCGVVGESIGNTQFYCTAFSASESWSYGEKIFTYTIPKVAAYKASYTGCCWITLYDGTAPGWEVAININSLSRPDTGRVNSSPITTMFPVVRLRLGFNMKISIPVTDPDNDVIICRWSDAARGECGGVCGIPAPAILDSNACELSFDSKLGKSGWYAVSISIEDFMSKNDTNAMSVVVTQFMVYVVNVNSNCLTAPIIIGDRPAASCVAVPIGVTSTERIVAKAGCSGVTITEIQVLGPTGTSYTSIKQVSGTTDQWEITITWTPTAAQKGQNIICAKAGDSVMLSSDLHCFTMLAGITPPKLVASTLTPSGILSAATLAGVNGFITWSVDFDQPILKPSKPAYIFFYHSNGVLLYQIDVSVFPTVTYTNYTLDFITFNNFADGSYYITFDYGVGVGSLYCQAQSDPEKSSTFWTFTVSTSTTTTIATTLQTATVPVTGANIVLTGLSSTASPILPLTTTLSTLSPTTTTTTTTTTLAPGATTTTSLSPGGTTTSTIATGSTTTISLAPGVTTTTTVANNAATTTTITATTTAMGSTVANKISTNEITTSQCSYKSFISTMALSFGAFLLIHCATMLLFFYKFLT